MREEDLVLEGADNLRKLVLQHMGMPDPQTLGYLTGSIDGAALTRHPLDPAGTGGKLALFVIEALCLIIRSQTLSTEQINRLTSVIESIDSHVTNITVDAEHLLKGLMEDGETDLRRVADRVRAILERLGHITHLTSHLDDPSSAPQPRSFEPGEKPELSLDEPETEKTEPAGEPETEKTEPAGEPETEKTEPTGEDGGAAAPTENL